MTQAIDYKHVSILWAGAENAAELAGLHGGLFDKPWDAAAFNGLLAHPGSTAFLARLGSPAEMAGFVVGQLAADEAEILTIAVRPGQRGRGHGRLLMEEALRRLYRDREFRALPARHVRHGADRYARPLPFHQHGADRTLPRRRAP